MKVLFVFSGNSPLGVSPFIAEQAHALQQNGVDVSMFPVNGKGIKGYLRHIFILRRHLNSSPVDIVHGHFLWSIIVCMFQRGCKKVGTFHGSDLNNKLLRLIAQLFVIPFLGKTIVVSSQMAAMIRSKNVSVIPCGVDTKIFRPLKSNCDHLHPRIDPTKKNILFSSRFDRYEKNYPLAKEVVQLLRRSFPVNLIELKDLTREEVNILLNQVDMLLMTSLWEGSPQVVKEAMACNCPVVTTDVGDVRWLLEGVYNCEVSGFDIDELERKVTQVILREQGTNGREKIFMLSLDLASISSRLSEIYKSLLEISDD